MSARCRVLLSFLLFFLLCWSSGAVAAPVPALKADQDANWETAWEVAWATAWEACGQVAANSIPSPMEDELLQTTVNLLQDEGQRGIDLVWGYEGGYARSSRRSGSGGAEASVGAYSAENARTAGKLFVQIEPADAQVEVLNATQNFTQGMDLESGEYVLSFKRQGFETQTKRVEVIPGMAATVRVNLTQEIQANNAESSPTAKPVASVGSSWDSLFKQLSLAPRVRSQGDSKNAASPIASLVSPQALAAPAASDGARRPSASASAFTAAPLERESVPPLPQGAFAAGQVASNGMLFVEAAPVGATVRVMNIKPKFKQGMELASGAYRVEVSMPGYKSVERTVELKSGNVSKVRVSLEKAAMGRLYVEADPAGAIVRVMNVRPKFSQGMELSEGKHRIEITLPGHKPVQHEVEVVANADNRIQLSLEPLVAVSSPVSDKPGRLYVHVDPKASVKILRIKPKFEQGIALPAGNYTLAATRKGFKDAKKEVEIVSGRDTFIAMELVSKNGPQQSKSAQLVPAAPVVPALAATVQKDERAKFDVDSFISMAIVAVNAGDFASALAAAKQALKLDPNAADAHKAMGDAYLLQEAFPEAIACYDRALAINPNDTRLRQNKNYAAEQVQTKGQNLKPTYGQAVIREPGMFYQLGKQTIP